MPFRERLVVRLPRAIDRGNLTVQSRDYPLTLYANTANAFVRGRLDNCVYFPEWAKTEIRIERSSFSFDAFSGSGGQLPIEVDFDQHEPVTLVLQNHSIDTEATFTLHIIGWQKGEL